MEMTGETDCTSGALFGSEISLTSVCVKTALRDWVPVCEVPPPNPPPLKTVNVLVPKRLIELATAWDEPVPTANNTITAATPMSTPSMVSKDRNLFELMPRKAMRALARTLTADPPMRSSLPPGAREPGGTRGGVTASGGGPV